MAAVFILIAMDGGHERCTRDFHKNLEFWLVICTWNFFDSIISALLLCCAKKNIHIQTYTKKRNTNLKLPSDFQDSSSYLASASASQHCHFWEEALSLLRVVSLENPSWPLARMRMLRCRSFAVANWPGTLEVFEEMRWCGEADLPVLDTVPFPKMMSWKLMGCRGWFELMDGMGGMLEEWWRWRWSVFLFE